jgi:hypothetical protein
LFFTLPLASLGPPVVQHYLLAVSMVSVKDQNMAANTILLLRTYGGYLLLAEVGRVDGSYE